MRPEFIKEVSSALSPRFYMMVCANIGINILIRDLGASREALPAYANVPGLVYDAKHFSKNIDVPDEA